MDAQISRTVLFLLFHRRHASALLCHWHQSLRTIHHRGVLLEPVVGWTTHHSIVEYKGHWYLFHHDCVPSNGITWLRSLKVKELYYDEQGDIKVKD